MTDLPRMGMVGNGLNASVVRSSIPSAVDAMVLKIRGLIADGGLVVGDSLPTERELCERFQASRNTVREAMRILKAYGVVSVRPKVGATIIDDRMERALDLFSFNTLDISRRTFNDIQGFRRLIEVGSVDTLFDLMRPEDIAEMRRINDQLRAAGTIAEASELDFRFHLRIVSILDNRAVRDVYGIMKPVIIRIMERAKELHNFTGDTYEQHAAVVDALEQRDRIRYQYALQSHLHIGIAFFEDSAEEAVDRDLSDQG
ncbi:MULTISPECIES: FCD domain-containing protein [Devosia]|uniref:HTH-type transcriptional regulator LutR n=1 Tax=Devosia equisanguinis TaxID=2490941 RepID=A0A447IC25_9HYPH|nr:MULTISPECIES: FCD domain-containing protein [Devosia]VDS05025.1 HTH-type transcriptional regulator LutR [Devosia equisanguinis]